jgi:YidC/Oxa1 family membrane protein insertase
MNKQQQSLIMAVLYAVLLGTGLFLWQKFSNSKQDLENKTSHNNKQITTELKDNLGHHYNVNHTVVENRLITVKTDNFIAKIDKLGGGLVSVELLKYKTELNGDQPVTIVSKKPEVFKVINSGFKGDEPVLFSSYANKYSLKSDQDKVVVELTGQNKEGVGFIKTYTFFRGKYDIGLKETLKNQSPSIWQSQLYLHVKQNNLQEEAGFGKLRTFTGFSYYTPKKHYNKIDMDDLDEAPVKVFSKGGWIASQQHYFITALIPPAGYRYHIFAGPINNGQHYVLKMLTDEQKLLPNQQMHFDSKVYVGPENAKELEKLSPGLGLTIDYGWLWFISNALFYLLELIYRYVPNWGVAIILLTLLVKVVFYRLSAKSFQSMAKMKKLQPQIEEIKVRYPDNREALAKATMELYKKEQVNPMGGCLPMLLQIPFFIALYWVLMESVELRHAPFFGWIHDLSSKDPYFVLPILMGLSMLWQQKLMPQQDPEQAKVMMVLPVVFTVMFLSFPSGLVLYWLTNNLLSILQQWYCMRKYDN